MSIQNLFNEDDFLIMNPGPLSITDLYANLEKASTPELAAVISKAFERSALDFEALIIKNKMEIKTETKAETLAEVNIKDLATKEDLKDLATKKDLKELKIDFHNELKHYATKEELANTVNTAVNRAKWQVIGIIGFTLLTDIVLKHFGV